MKGVFVTFEGPEGGGKSTQIRLLAARLEVLGHEVVLAREPGGTAAGEVIRNLLQHDTAGEHLCAAAETLLFSASRAQLVHEVIVPALARGATVLCDRFADSTTAYQGYGRGFDPDELAHLHAFALGNHWPDVTLLLDVPAAVGLKRIHARAGGGNAGLDRMEREAQEFHLRVAEGFRLLAARYGDRFRILDATETPEQVHARILALLAPWFPALHMGEDA
ncbi:MAG: dTMP kinase [Kiritimatiellia bacterium]